MLFHSCKDSSIWLEWTSSHQCTSSGWGSSSRFGGWTQTHPSRAFLFSFSPAQGFFSHLLCPKVFPSYLPTPSPPKPKFILSPLGLASFFSPPSPKLWGKLRNIETQGSLGKWWRKGVWSFNPMANVWAEGKLSPSPSFLKFQSFFFVVKKMMTNIIVFFCSLFEKKKMMVFLPSSFFFLTLLQRGWQQLSLSSSSQCLRRRRRWHSCHHLFFSLLCCKKDDNNYLHLYLLIVWEKDDGILTIIFFLPCFATKRTTTATVVIFFSLFDQWLKVKAQSNIHKK